MRHYPYKRSERSHYQGMDRPGSNINAAWASIQHDAKLAKTYADRKAGLVPWIDPVRPRQAESI